MVTVVGGINMKEKEKQKNAPFVLFLTGKLLFSPQTLWMPSSGEKNPAHIQQATMASPGLTFHIYSASLAK